jgi:hypothetical protein
MTSPNGNTGATLIPNKLDTAAVTEFWLSSSARLMRSSEVFMRGMAAVGRLEAELGQEFLNRRMASFQATGLHVKPDERVRAQIGQTVEEFDSLVTGLRKIADEFRHTLNDSTQALFDVAAPPPAQSMAASIHIDEPPFKRKPAPAAA